MSGAILVTGATGFVGRALLTGLAGEARPVIALVRQHRADFPPHVIQRIAGDIETLDADGWLTVLEGVEVVVHLAGIAHIGPGVAEARYDTVNHRAVTELAGAARLAGVRRIVFASSIRAQCGASAEAVQTETTPPAPTDAYGRSKRAAEQALAASGVEHVIMRPALIVGPAAKGNLRLLMTLADTPWPLPFAGLDAQRAMISLDDVVAITRRAMDDPAMAGQTFLLADPDMLSFSAVIAALRDGLGRPRRLFFMPAALLALPFRLIGRMDVWERIAGPLRARPEGLIRLGYQPIMPVRQALTALGRSRAR